MHTDNFFFLVSDNLVSFHRSNRTVLLKIRANVKDWYHNWYSLKVFIENSDQIAF